MVLLDLSAAFDTVCHSRLLAVLRDRNGHRRSALEWFCSYLSDRTQTVMHGDSSAPTTVLERGVPQGSVLGPSLFSIYTLALGDIVRKHGLDAHFMQTTRSSMLSPLYVGEVHRRRQRMDGCQQATSK